MCKLLLWDETITHHATSGGLLDATEIGPSGQVGEVERDSVLSVTVNRLVVVVICQLTVSVQMSKLLKRAESR